MLGYRRVKKHVSQKRLHIMILKQHPFYFTSVLGMSCTPVHGYYIICLYEGNCLELADDGILNHVPCNKMFEFGCPDKFYLSNEIYKCKQFCFGITFQS